MSISIRAVSLALPAVLGLACMHARTAQAPAAESQVAPSGEAATAAPVPRYVVAGTVTQVTGESVSLKTDQGEERTLDVSPQTLVTIGGQQATLADLQEGQDIRASYDTVNGRDVALRIDTRETEAEPAQPGTGAEGRGGGSMGGAASPPDTRRPERR